MSFPNWSLKNEWLPRRREQKNRKCVCAPAQYAGTTIFEVHNRVKVPNQPTAGVTCPRELRKQTGDAQANCQIRKHKPDVPYHVRLMVHSSGLKTNKYTHMPQSARRYAPGFGKGAVSTAIHARIHTHTHCTNCNRGFRGTNYCGHAMENNWLSAGFCNMFA